MVTYNHRNHRFFFPFFFSDVQDVHFLVVENQGLGPPHCSNGNQRSKSVQILMI